jgi:hypothetical protein
MVLKVVAVAVTQVKGVVAVVIVLRLALMQLVETLAYNLEDRGLDFRWGI